MFPFRHVVDPKDHEVLRSEVEHFDRDYDIDRTHREMAEFAEKMGITYLDLTSLMSEHYQRGGESLYFHVNDMHLNARGHRFIADHTQSLIASHLQ